MAPRPLELELRSFVEEALGPIDEAKERSHAFGEADLWRVVARSGQVAWLKRTRHPQSHAHEAEAYARLGAHPGTRPFLADLLASSSSLCALLLGEAAGLPGESVQLDAETRLAMHRAAGAFRRALDELSPGTDPLALPDALGRRLDAWCERAGRALEASQIAAIRLRFDAELFEGTERRPCHRDFRPANWRVARRGAAEVALTVLDFGHFRDDVWLVDLLKLWDGPWTESAGAFEAFFEGLGRDLDGHELAQLEQLALLHALGTTAWAADHHDSAREAHGRHMLRVLLDGGFSALGLPAAPSAP